MAVTREYIGRIAVKLVDGRKLEFNIYKSGHTIWLGDHIVPPSHNYSWSGLDAEIGQYYRAAVEDRSWVENTGKSLF